MLGRLAAVTAALALLLLPAHGAAHAAPATIDDFFAAAALQPSDLPAGLTPVTNGALSPDQLIAQGGPGAGAELAGLSLLGVYGQAERATSPVALLSGRPAGVGDLITVFATPADAA